MEAGKLTIDKEPTSVAAVLAGVSSLMEPLAREKGPELRRQSESSLPESFECDPYRLRQVLLNLVGNATKFTRSGTITVVSRVDPNPDRRSGTLHIEVRDTDVGMLHDLLASCASEISTTR